MTNENVKLVSDKDIVFDGKFWIDKKGVKHRYINPLHDEGFKILFGTEGNEDLLIDLLNKVLPATHLSPHLHTYRWRCSHPLSQSSGLADSFSC